MVDSLRALPGARGGRIKRLLGRYACWPMRDEPIEVIEQWFNYLPGRFRWRGSVQRVRWVLSSWERSRAGRRAARRYFQVICHEGTDHIVYQDLQVGTWHVSR